MAEVPLNDAIRDLAIRHHVGVQRLSSGILKQLAPLLDRSDAEIVKRLLDRGPTLEGSFTSTRLKFLLDAIRDMNHDVYVEIGNDLRGELRGAAQYEVDFTQRMLNTATPAIVDFVAPSATFINAVVTARPFQGKLLKDAVKGLETGRFQQLKDAIQLGMIQGETMPQIVRRIAGTKSLNFQDGILQRPRSALESLVRTATNHVANVAREKLYEENDDLIDGVQFVATLDTRTCPTCGGYDGQVFKIGKGPRPPIHRNCRCSTAPVVKSWRAMGIDADELPAGTRASMNGQVSETETFNTWLKKQGAATQDETLGATRGKLFRRGGLDINRFTDVRGNSLTLDQLRKKEADAFEKIGM